MRKWTADLLALQVVDLRIRGLKTKLMTIPTERARLAASVDDAMGVVKAAKEALQKAEQHVKGIEASIAQANADIVKLQNQSILVKKNDEYQAMLKQIEDCKTRISDFETEEIGYFDKVESARNALKAAEKALADRERSVKSEMQEFVQLEADIKAEGSALVASRKSYEAKIDPTNLAVYNRLAGTGKGEPVTLIKDGVICSNCRLRLTPQTLGQAKGGLMALCDNCAHIVYVDVPDNAS